MVSSKDFSVLRSSSFFGASRNRVLWRSYCCSPITLLQVVAYSIVRVSSLQKMPILFQLALRSIHLDRSQRFACPHLDTMLGQTRYSVRILAALFLIFLLPIDLIGWANPITSAGTLFPALSWAGLLLTLVFLMQLGSTPKAFTRLLPFVALSIGANIFYLAPVLHNWIALDTHLGTSKNTDSAFDQMQTLQQLVSEASERLPHTKVFVLPE